MCELFGFSSKTKQDIRPYLSEFYSHSTEHPNGWGLARLDDGMCEISIEATMANNSNILPKLIDDYKESATTLAHIRKATVGSVKTENCHPFVGVDKSWRRWTLIHNGTIFNGLQLLLYSNKQTGDTDSERILLYLIDKMNEEIELKGCSLNPNERFNVVEKLVSDLSYRNKINLLIYDGEQMYVHVNMRNTLFVKQEKDSALFSTTPLEKSGWEHLPMTTLLVFRDGKLIYTGQSHHNEYIDTMEQVEQMEHLDYII